MVNVHWYGYLVKQDEEGKVGLLDRESYDDKCLVVSQEYGIRLFRYAKFPTRGDHINYLQDNRYVSRYEQLCFYEIISGNYPFKPFFDLDAERTIFMDESLIIDANLKGKKIKLNVKFSVTEEQAVECVKELVRCIKQLYPFVEDTDILITRAHGKNKISNHVIIDRWCFNYMEDMKALCDEVCKIYPPEYLEIIDKGIYNKGRQLRMYGSHKFGDLEESRQKTLDENSKWETKEECLDDTHRWSQIFLASLVTNASYCKILPTFRKEEIKTIYTGKTIVLSEDEVTDALNLFAKTTGCNSYLDSEFPFVLKSVESSKIELKRVNSSYCKVCERDHDSIHQYLTIKGIERNVLLWCYRKDGHSYLVGKLKPNLSNDTQEVIKFEHIAIEEEPKLQRLPPKKNPIIINDLYSGSEIKNYSGNPLDDINKLKFIQIEKKKTIKEEAELEGIGNYFSKIKPENLLKPPSLNKKIKKSLLAVNNKEKTIRDFKNVNFYNIKTNSTPETYSINLNTTQNPTTQIPNHLP